MSKQLIILLYIVLFVAATNPGKCATYSRPDSHVNSMSIEEAENKFSDNMCLFLKLQIISITLKRLHLDFLLFNIRAILHRKHPLNHESETRKISNLSNELKKHLHGIFTTDSQYFPSEKHKKYTLFLLLASTNRRSEFYRLITHLASLHFKLVENGRLPPKTTFHLTKYLLKRRKLIADRQVQNPPNEMQIQSSGSSPVSISQPNQQSPTSPSLQQPGALGSVNNPQISTNQTFSASPNHATNSSPQLLQNRTQSNTVNGSQFQSNQNFQARSSFMHSHMDYQANNFNPHFYESQSRSSTVGSLCGQTASVIETSDAVPNSSHSEMDSFGEDFTAFTQDSNPNQPQFEKTQRVLETQAPFFPQESHVTQSLQNIQGFSGQEPQLETVIEDSSPTEASNSAASSFFEQQDFEMADSSDAASEVLGVETPTNCSFQQPPLQSEPEQRQSPQQTSNLSAQYPDSIASLSDYEPIETDVHVPNNTALDNIIAASRDQGMLAEPDFSPPQTGCINAETLQQSNQMLYQSSSQNNASGNNEEALINEPSPSLQTDDSTHVESSSLTLNAARKSSAYVPVLDALTEVSENGNPSSSLIHESTPVGSSANSALDQPESAVNSRPLHSNAAMAINQNVSSAVESPCTTGLNAQNPDEEAVIVKAENAHPETSSLLRPVLAIGNNNQDEIYNADEFPPPPSPSILLQASNRDSADSSSSFPPPPDDSMLTNGFSSLSIAEKAVDDLPLPPPPSVSQTLAAPPPPSMSKSQLPLFADSAAHASSSRMSSQTSRQTRPVQPLNTPTFSNDRHTLLAQIAKGVKLKPINSTVSPKQNSSVNDPRSNILRQIRSGAVLRNTGITDENRKILNSEAKRQNNVHDAMLESVLLEREKARQSNDTSSENSDEWSS